MQGRLIGGRQIGRPIFLVMLPAHVERRGCECTKKAALEQPGWQKAATSGINQIKIGKTLRGGETTEAADHAGESRFCGRGT